MKYFNIILLLIIAKGLFPQSVFNVIIEDTIPQITNSVVALDTGYVFLSGLDNEDDIRSFGLTFIDSFGNTQWKNIFGDSEHETWEGWHGCFKETHNGYYLCGSYRNIENTYRGIHINDFDSTFHLIRKNITFYDTIWYKCFDNIKSIDSSYFITGQIYNYDEEKYRMLFLKADNSGNYLWHKLFGNNVYEYGSHIIELSNGNIITAGNSWVTNINNTRWYIINTDTAGNIIWEKYYGRSGFNNGYVTSMLETPDSCILACGTYPAAGYGAGGDEILPDGCLRKIDMNGDLVWEKHYKSYLLSHTGDIYFHNKIYSICAKNEYIYALGWNYGYVSWKDRGYLMKMNEEGNILWKREYYAIDSNSYSQWLVSFKPTSDNGFILAGYGNSYNTHGFDPPQQAWLVKTDSLGMDGLCNTEPDELNIDIEIPEIPESICSDDTIQVYVHISGKSAPYTLEFSTGQVIDSIYYPPTFVPIEIGLTDINLQWNNQTYFEETITEATLSNHEWGQCIVKPVEFYTPATLGTHEIQVTVTDAYGESTSITKEVYVTQCSTYNGIEQNSGIIIYPNPATDFLHIEITDPAYSHVEVFDILGQLVLTAEIKQVSNSIDIRNLFPGSYVIKLSGKNGKTETLFFEKE